jgi:hypothetical protein
MIPAFRDSDPALGKVNPSHPAKTQTARTGSRPWAWCASWRGEVATGGDFTRFRRAAETPFNMVLEARP